LAQAKKKKAPVIEKPDFSRFLEAARSTRCILCCWRLQPEPDAASCRPFSGDINFEAGKLHISNSLEETNAGS
jgi:hypothetical protein